MEKVFHAGGKIFFTTLIICIVSYLYFTILPLNNNILNIGYIFSMIYFGINFYTGITEELTICESILVGVIGCIMGLFLLFFSLYTLLVIGDSQMALWLIKPYFIPTMSIVKAFLYDITMFYPIMLMIINICLVVMGSIIRKIMNKLKL